MTVEIYENSNGEECVVWTDEEGSMHSMLKSEYDRREAEAKEAAPKK
jgi:hypothetical protein